MSEIPRYSAKISANAASFAAPGNGHTLAGAVFLASFNDGQEPASFAAVG